jgi:hypothetical protein
MNKKGQVSIFVILGVVILVGVVLFFNLNDSEIEKVDIEVQPIYAFFENCIEKEGKDAIKYLGETGGYFDVPENSHLEIPYYFYEGRNEMPGREFIEQQLSKYVNLGLPHCIYDLKDFEDYNVQGGEYSSSFKIEDEKVIFDMDVPLSITKGDSTYDIRKFQIEIPVRLGVIYDAISEYMVDQLEAPGEVCVSCLYDIGKKYDLDINILESDIDGVLMFIVSDSNYKINNENYSHYFMVKLEEEK